MFPLIPILCLAAIAGGTGGLIWYDSLNQPDKDKANELAANYAWQQFAKSIDQLSAAEARHVHALTARHFNN